MRSRNVNATNSDRISVQYDDDFRGGSREYLGFAIVELRSTRSDLSQIQFNSTNSQQQQHLGLNIYIKILQYCYDNKTVEVECRKGEEGIELIIDCFFLHFIFTTVLQVLKLKNSKLIIVQDLTNQHGYFFFIIKFHPCHDVNINKNIYILTDKIIQKNNRVSVILI